MVELDPVGLELALVLDVGGRLVEHRAGRLEVGVLDDDDAVMTGVAQRPQHRMALADEQAAAGPQNVATTSAQRRTSATSSARRRRCRRGRIVRRRAHRRRRTRRPRRSRPSRRRRPRQAAGDVERRRREVESGDPGAQPCQRQRVGADVALQVHDVEAGDVAEPRQVEPHDAGDVRGSDVALEAVFGRRRVVSDSARPVRGWPVFVLRIGCVGSSTAIIVARR